MRRRTEPLTVTAEQFDADPTVIADHLRRITGLPLCHNDQHGAHYRVPRPAYSWIGTRLALAPGPVLERLVRALGGPDRLSLILPASDQMCLYVVGATDDLRRTDATTRHQTLDVLWTTAQMHRLDSAAAAATGTGNAALAERRTRAAEHRRAVLHNLRKAHETRSADAAMRALDN